ncbi:MAG: endolytic transglycosylase MltG, partial [Peptostreptococcaceae bacterium]|nr:endolytic transglycosylase MltG [Peptostreptococcaceae bacterium]
QNKPQEQNKTSKSKTITIASGSSAGSIAGTLKSNGLISDTNAFLNKVVASGKENKLKAGTFTIPSNASVDQIINILTK